jgi:hypothetical protein
LLTDDFPSGSGSGIAYLSLSFGVISCFPSRFPPAGEVWFLFPAVAAVSGSGSGSQSSSDAFAVLFLLLLPSFPGAVAFLLGAAEDGGDLVVEDADDEELLLFDFIMSTAGAAVDVVVLFGAHCTDVRAIKRRRSKTRQLETLLNSIFNRLLETKTFQRFDEILY